MEISSYWKSLQLLYNFIILIYQQKMYNFHSPTYNVQK